MDNQTSSPQLVFPNVPDDFCPSGNWTQVFQAFVDEVLTNGTINVPGLGDVTPEQISTINAQLQSQQNQITALDTRVTAVETEVEDIPIVIVLTGTIAIPGGAGPHTLNVSLSPALPSATYGISIVPIGSATARANMGSYVVDPTQTASSFIIYAQDNPATVTSLRWTAIHTS